MNYQIIKEFSVDDNNDRLCIVQLEESLILVYKNKKILTKYFMTSHVKRSLGTSLLKENEECVIFPIYFDENENPVVSDWHCLPNIVNGLRHEDTMQKFIDYAGNKTIINIGMDWREKFFNLFEDKEWHNDVRRFR